MIIEVRNEDIVAANLVRTHHAFIPTSFCPVAQALTRAGYDCPSVGTHSTEWLDVGVHVYARNSNRLCHQIILWDETGQFRPGRYLLRED